MRQRYDRLAGGWHDVVEQLGFGRAYRWLFEVLGVTGYLAHLPEGSAVMVGVRPLAIYPVSGLRGWVKESVAMIGKMVDH